MSCPQQHGWTSSKVTGIIADLAPTTDRYAWAARLRDIPDKDALQELAQAGSRGYVANGVARRTKFSFTGGTGSGQRGKRSGSSRSAAGNGRRRS